MQTLLADLRFAWRQLVKSPAFAVTAVVSLAVGLAASTTVFSLADALLFRPRPGIADPDRLVDVGRTQRGGGFDTISYPNYADVRDQNQVFSGVAAYRVEPAALSLDARGSVDRVYGMVVSANYFAVLGVTARARPRSSCRPRSRVAEPGPVAVISHRLWRQRFDADPRIVGTRRPAEQPAGDGRRAWRPKASPEPSVLVPDLWLPLSMQPALSGGDRGLFDEPAGRLADGVRPAPARASRCRRPRPQMTTLAARLARDYPDANKDKGHPARAVASPRGPLQDTRDAVHRRPRRCSPASSC